MPSYKNLLHHCHEIGFYNYFVFLYSIVWKLSIKSVFDSYIGLVLYMHRVIFHY